MAQVSKRRDAKAGKAEKPRRKSGRPKGAIDRAPRKQRTDSHAGPGRPAGSTNALPLGAVGAIKSLRRTPPEGAPQEDLDLAEETFATVVKVMRGDTLVGLALPRLKAATLIRDEVCGPMVRRVEIADPHGIVPRIQAGRERAAAAALAAERAAKGKR
jgi:hypothetical protein